MKKSVSLKDIAREVGVSASLVSYVLNGHAKEKRVGDEIAKKVIKTAQRLNYVPNQIAKSLKTKKSHTIGFIVGEIYYRFTIDITRSIESEAKKNGYTVIIGNSHEDLLTLRELIDVLINRQVDGLIIIAAEKAEAEVEYLQKREIPFVLIDRNFPTIKTNFIGIDNCKVAYKATEYLIKSKRKSIAFVNYSTSFFHLQERNRGYFEALKHYKLRCDKSLHKEIRKSSFNEDMKQAVIELTSGTVPCDAMFFATDTLAINGLKNLVELKVNIPDDIAVFSFDESEAFALFHVPITYYRQPLEEIGKSAVNLLFEIMNDITHTEQISLESTLVMGKSCGEK
jgi:LacI family transcriptional regulator